MPSQDAHNRSTRPPFLAGGVLAVVAVGSVGVPLALAVWRAVIAAKPAREVMVPDAAPGWQVVMNTLAYPLGIGLLATALGWMTAWRLREMPARRARAVLVLLCLVLLMPNYLGYAGWSLARAPGTWVGDALMRGEGGVWLNVNFTRMLAVMGLVLWAWPISVLALLGAVRAVPREQLDQLALSGAGEWTGFVQRVRMVRGAVVASVGIVALVMLGSVVPLHLSLIKTLSIELWARLALEPGGAGVWRAAWPLVVIAVIGASLITRAIMADPPPEASHYEPSSGRAGGWKTAVLALLWCLALIAPFVLFAGNVGQARFLMEFWRENAGIVGQSLGTAAACGVGLLVIALAAFRACDDRRTRPVVRIALGVFLLGMLLPGVLVGAAVGRMWDGGWLGSQYHWVGFSPLVALGHVARFGALGVGAGVWLWRTEPAALRDARLLAGGHGLRAWWTLTARPRVGTLIGIGVAGAAMSLHEIEATVQLQPPGYRSLAQLMLDHLHMNSIQELAAAAVNVLGVGLVLAGVGVWGIGKTRH